MLSAKKGLIKFFVILLTVFAVAWSFAACSDNGDVKKDTTDGEIIGKNYDEETSPESGDVSPSGETTGGGSGSTGTGEDESPKVIVLPPMSFE